MRELLGAKRTRLLAVGTEAPSASQVPRLPSPSTSVGRASPSQLSPFSLVSLHLLAAEAWSRPGTGAETAEQCRHGPSRRLSLQAWCLCAREASGSSPVRSLMIGCKPLRLYCWINRVLGKFEISKRLLLNRNSSKSTCGNLVRRHATPYRDLGPLSTLPTGDLLYSRVCTSGRTKISDATTRILTGQLAPVVQQRATGAFFSPG